MNHAFTIDVEDDISIGMHDRFGVHVPPTEAVVRNTERVLAILREYSVRGTFFVLGEVAETFPALVRGIAAQGHEIGIHGYTHRQYFLMDRQQAFNELSKAKSVVEDLIGRAVLGHRAPAFSIRPDTSWVLDVLLDAGFTYDSSIVPCPGKRYGWPGCSKDIHAVKREDGRSIVEVPLSTANVFGREMVACGGGYLRHFPWALTWRSFCSVERKRPVIVYIHPYEIDTSLYPEEFRERLRKGPCKQRWLLMLKKHSRRSMETKLRNLLSLRSFVPLCELMDAKRQDQQRPNEIA